MPTTIRILGQNGPIEIPLKIPSERVCHALALLTAGLSPVQVLDLQVVAVALAWPGEPPWTAAEAAEVAATKATILEAEWLLRQPGTEAEDRRAALAELAAARAALATAEAAHAAARVTLGEPATWAAHAERVVAAVRCPAWALYQAGERLVVEAQSKLLEGWDAYQGALASGFTTAPAGQSSPGASDSPTDGAATPFSGSR